MAKVLERFALRDESGQDAAEYALILAFLVIVIVATVAAFGSSLAQIFAGIVALFP